MCDDFLPPTNMCAAAAATKHIKSFLCDFLFLPAERENSIPDEDDDDEKMAAWYIKQERGGSLRRSIEKKKILCSSFLFLRFAALFLSSSLLLPPRLLLIQIESSQRTCIDPGLPTCRNIIRPEAAEASPSPPPGESSSDVASVQCGPGKKRGRRTLSLSH